MESGSSPSLVGQTLDSRYQIIESVGDGSTGVIYRARQINVDRDVAIKVLAPPATSEENIPDILARFETEAKIVSKLRHPHTVKVYDFGRISDGRLFLVMEFLQGESLAKLLEKGALDEKRTLRIIRQTAEALTEAHEQGIIHRDIKPSNIFVEKVGSQDQVKILDFGIAKVAAKHLKTATGMVIGTPAYMSPEQAQGQELDPRSDIYSLGVVAYHCLSGRLPFDADTPVGLLVKHVTLPPPPLRSLENAPKVSAGFERLIERMLSKKKEDRPLSAIEVRDAVLFLEQQSQELLPQGQTSKTIKAMRAAARGRWQSLWLWMGLGATILCSIPLIYWFQRSTGENVSRSGQPAIQPEQTLPAAVVTQLTDQQGNEFQPAFSPEGKFLAYASNISNKQGDIFLLRMGGDRPINLTPNSTRFSGQPAFSPDGSQIAFFSNREGEGVYLMGATGEAVRRLIPSPAYNPTWTPDGKEIIFSTEAFSDPNQRSGMGELWALEIASGKKRLIFKGDAVQPSVSPHGLRVAFWGTKSGQRDVWTVGIDGKNLVAVTNDAPTDYNPLWSPDGQYLYLLSDRSGSMNLWRIAIDEKTGNLLGELQPITNGASNMSDLAISATGQFVYCQGSYHFSLKRIALNLAKENTEGESETIMESSRSFLDFDLSPDGKLIALYSNDPQDDIVVMNRDGTGRRYLTKDSYRDRRPRFSPDGKTIAFYSNRSGKYETWLIQVDGSDLRQLTDMGNEPIYPNWSPDGRKLSMVALQDKGGLILSEIPETGMLPKANPIFRYGEQSTELLPADWSKAGDRLAVTVTHKEKEPNVGVFNISDEKLEIFEKVTGGEPRWLADGRHLLFKSEKGIMLLDWTTKATKLLLEPPKDWHIFSFAVSSDNRELFYMIGRGSADLWLLSPK